MSLNKDMHVQTIQEFIVRPEARKRVIPDTMRQE